jgi:hypothetical protein
VATSFADYGIYSHHFDEDGQCQRLCVEEFDVSPGTWQPQLDDDLVRERDALSVVEIHSNHT